MGAWKTRKCGSSTRNLSQISKSEFRSSTRYFRLYIYSIYPSIHLFIHPSVYSSIHLSIYPSLYTSIHLSIHLSPHLSIYPSTRLYTHLSIYPSIHPSIYPFIHRSIYRSNLYLGKYEGPHPVPGGGRILQQLRLGG